MFDTLKSLLGINDINKDAAVQFALDTAASIVLDYCNIESVPEGLKNTVIRMAMDIYRNDNFGSEKVKNDVKSYQLGDTSKTFEFGGSDNYNLGILKNYKVQLNRYRKVGFN